MAELNFKCPVCEGSDVFLKWRGHCLCELNGNGTVECLDEHEWVEGFFCSDCDYQLSRDDGVLIEDVHELIEWLKVASLRHSS